MFRLFKRKKVNVGHTQVWLTIDGMGKRIEGWDFYGEAYYDGLFSIHFKSSIERAKYWTYKEAKKGVIEISETETLPISRIFKIEFETVEHWVEV